MLPLVSCFDILQPTLFPRNVDVKILGSAHGVFAVALTAEFRMIGLVGLTFTDDC